MNSTRMLKHLLITQQQITRFFPQNTLDNIKAAIKTSETSHSGEIRFVLEKNLAWMSLYKGQSAKERAFELFTQLKVWDTEQNNGVLIYLLIADHAVEIVADRGIYTKVDTATLTKICQQMTAEFKQSNYEGGVILGIKALTQILTEHFPANDNKNNNNELPNTPVILN